MSNQWSNQSGEPGSGVMYEDETSCHLIVRKFFVSSSRWGTQCS